MNIMKGILIILMVIGHSVRHPWEFIYFFHMSVFFMASGYFYKWSSVDDVRGFISKKIRGLYLPFVLSGLIVLIIHNWLVDISFISNEKYTLVNAFNSLISELSFSTTVLSNYRGALWFLRTLFVCSITYLFIDKLSSSIFEVKDRRLLFNGIITFVLLCVGWMIHSVFEYNVPLKIDRDLSCSFLFFLGHAISVKREKLLRAINWRIVMFCFGLLFTFSFLTDWYISINKFHIVNPIFFILCSLAGWYMIYGLSVKIEHQKIGKKVLNYIGSHTLPIVILHYFAFKIVTYMIVYIYDMPLCEFSEHRIIYEHSLPYYWIAYTIVGVGVPLLCYEAYMKVKSNILRLIHRQQRNTRHKCSLNSTKD